MGVAVVMLPGASLMDVQVEGDILVITCPGCHGTLRVLGPCAGDVHFVHKGGCPIHQRIQVLLSAGAKAPGGVQ